ncbi:MAG: hypothetical protein CMF62_04560 [Magnetococcales bacterium]|nr:hypothetical protein [Magnetococcales bacterium]
MRILKIIIAILVILPVALYLVREPLIKMAVNNVGTQVVGTEVNLDDVTFKPFSGLLELKGFSVANPQGYESPYAVTLGGVKVQLEPKSLLSNRIQIQEITITDPAITIEGGMKKNNLTDLQEGMMKNLPASSEEAAPAEEPAAAEGEGKKVEIDLVQVQSGKVSITKPIALTANLGTITMRDIGKEGDNVTLAEFINNILNAVINDATKSATSEMAKQGKAIMDKAGAEAQGKVDEIGNKIKGFFGCK